MPELLLAVKMGMTRVFDESGASRAVTVLDCSGCQPGLVRTVDRDGYDAVQVCRKVSRLKTVVVEARGVSALDAAFIATDKTIDVIGVSKGRGTAGVMKRHNFSGQRATHGVKKCHRHPGSTGQSTDPSRVFKGTKMAGRYGAERVTVRNLDVVRYTPDTGVLLVDGSVPGHVGSVVIVRKSVEP